MPRISRLPGIAVACLLMVARAQAQHADPVPHALITQPYRVCQDLDELTARIDSLYRKPLDRAIDAKTGVMQPETVYFKDTRTGHEVTCLTRELCTDIAHGDLGRPCWTADGRRILFMGNRAFIDAKGQLSRSRWDGWKYIMDADYTSQRALVVRFDRAWKDRDGNTITRSAGIYSKFNILDINNPRDAYYAIEDKLWRLTISDGLADHQAELLCQFATPHTKIIQDISSDGRLLLVQDANAEFDRAAGRPKYMPEIHLIDLTLRPGEAGHYRHHPFDYGLAEVKGPDGKVVHDAANNYQFHSLAFGTVPNTICWNYGPMTSVGEYLGWTLDISKGLDGPPTHGPLTAGSGGNKWGQYESHGKGLGRTAKGLYFSGPIKMDGKETGGWGIWLRDYADETVPPKFLLVAPGGHVAGGNSDNPDVWAAYISAGWRDKVKESDAIVWGRASAADARTLCYTYSDVRGGIQRDRKTGAPIKWSGPDNADFRPYSSIPRPLLSPDGTKCWFHSSMLMPTEDYVGIYVATIQRPQPPRNLRLADGGRGVTLQWQPAAVSHETRCYHVYRGNADGTDMAELTDAPVPHRADAAACGFADASAAPGRTYTYAVTAEEWSTLESDSTSNALVVTLADAGLTAKPGDALRSWDKTPPPAVAGFAVMREPGEDGRLSLRWDKDPARDLRHYNVYCSAGSRPEIAQRCLVVSPPASATGYLDWSAPADRSTLYYAITAVDRQGNESPPAYAQWTAGR